MNVQQQIDNYIASQPPVKRSDLEALHQLLLKLMPGCMVRFEDGKNSENKTVSNPTIGYGNHTMKYAGGKTREVFKIGLSANTAGISVYILGIADKTYLVRTYGEKLGKATITGYCIRFKALKDIDTRVLETAIRDAVAA